MCQSHKANTGLGQELKLALSLAQGNAPRYWEAVFLSRHRTDNRKGRFLYLLDLFFCKGRVGGWCFLLLAHCPMAGTQSPKDLDHCPLLSQVISRELDQKWGSRDLNQHPYRMQALHAKV